MQENFTVLLLYINKTDFDNKKYLTYVAACGIIALPRFGFYFFAHFRMTEDMRCIPCHSEGDFHRN